MKRLIRYRNKTNFFLIVFAVLFSNIIMFSTFSYGNESMRIASKAWSDFDSHIALIRSFSLGDNFPPQYPLFAGPPIRYHFLFYFLVGMLEKIGFRIDLALNSLSILGFSSLIIIIYFFSKKLFKSTIVAVLSVLFFLFNGSLSFVNFISKYKISESFISQIINNTVFPSFGPYDNSTVSAFWNLNIYTNQRHFAPSLAISLTLIFFLIKPIFSNKKINLYNNLIIGAILGTTFLLNMAVFTMNILIIFFVFILFKELKKGVFLTLLISCLIAIPQYLLTQSTGSSSKLLFLPGYLISNNFSFINFINYWFHNLGLHLFLIPFGFILSNRKVKKIFLAFLSLFVIANIFQFAPEMAANHKFFNYFMIIGVMFSAFAIKSIWDKNKITKTFTPLLLFLLIFSGIIDFFPIFNDRKIDIKDYTSNENVLWILKNTKRDSVFLNSSFLYDDASIAGRKIFLGWPYFSWSQGYDTDARNKTMSEILGQENITTACRLLLKNEIDFIEIKKNSNQDPNYPHVSSMFRKKFRPDYESQDLIIYNSKKNCI